MNDMNVPMDAIAMHAEEIVKAAIIWRWSLDSNPMLTAAEWKLFEATGEYGDTFRGLRAQ